MIRNKGTIEPIKWHSLIWVRIWQQLLSTYKQDKTALIDSFSVYAIEMEREFNERIRSRLTYDDEEMQILKVELKKVTK